MRRLSKMLFCLFLITGLHQPVAAEVIKLGTIAPEGSVWYTVLRDMADSWREISGDRIKIRIYPGGVAGDDADMVRKMKIGQLHAAALTGQGLATIAAELGVFQMPMLLRSNDELDFVRSRMSAKLEAALESQGFKLLYWSDVGWVYLFAKKPVRNPDDLRKIKLWVWSGNSDYAAALKNLGYQPVPLPATEIHTGLQSGLIDAFTTTPIAALSAQWFGQAKHMTRLKWAPLTAGVVISRKVWDRLPDDIKPALLRASDKARDIALERIRQLEDESIAVMRQYGLTVHDVTPEAARIWREESEAGYPALMKRSLPRDTFDEVVALLREFRGRAGTP